ncbi:CBS domain-containing protein [Streptomyces sp. NPDC003042]
MRARDLAVPWATVPLDADAASAARLLIAERLPGVLVLDSQGQPYAVLTGDRMVRMLVPGYVQSDQILAAVIDEPHADRLGEGLAGRQIADCLPYGPPFLPEVEPDATAVEIADAIARTRSPLVAVIEHGPGRRRLHGVITAAQLLERLLTAAETV